MPSRRVALRAAAGLVAAAVLTTAVVIAGRDSAVSPRSVDLVLTRAATVAANTPLPELGAGNFLYQRTEMVERRTSVSDEGDWSALVPTTRELWIAPDGSGRIRELTGEPRFPGARDRTRWEAAGRPSLEKDPVDMTVPEGRFLPSASRSLPTRLNELEREILRRGRNWELPRSETLFVGASDLLSNPFLEPLTRSRLYRVISRIEGVRSLGEVRDAAGRLGVGVALTTRFEGALARRVLIFDPATSAILESENVLLHPIDSIDAAPPVTVESRLFTVQSVVPTLQARPATA